jgi:hypothetical protein
MNIFNIISIAAITFLFIYAEPSILFKRFCRFKEEDYEKYSKAKRMVFRLITCSLCSGFWIGLLFTFSFQQAALISLMAEVIDRLMKKI